VTPFNLVTAALYLVPTLVWGIMARQLWSYRRARRPAAGSPVPRNALFMSAVAATFLVHAAWSLVPVELQRNELGAVGVLHLLVGVTALVSLALGLHVLRLTPVPEEPPSAWVTPVYVWTALTLLAMVPLHVLGGAHPRVAMASEVIVSATAALLAVLCAWHALRLARPGPFGPESAGEVRRPDVVLVVAGLLAATVVFLVLVAAGARPLADVAFEAGVGVALAAPWTLRMLGIVVPEFLVSVTLPLAAGAVALGWVALVPRVAPAFHSLLDFAALLALAVVVVPGQRWLRAAADRLVLGRSRHQLAALQTFLHTLSPELGAVECCRRALAELTRVRNLRGAAIILRDGEVVVHGAFNLAPLLRVWPRGSAADALPARSFGTMELRELPLALREAMVEANVGLGAAPILSPRRRWGHLFLNTGLLGGFYREDDLDEFQAFVAQLALLLDGAYLLARTVAVERSLAHAERLAAIGETAARIAHEIRNPVTAARSLAQQLAREPGAAHAAEHGLILAELERVERHVAALLRFARHEELRLEAVDLGEMVRATVATFRPRLEADRVALALEVADGVVARVDREKLRQVVINLVENALDALGEVPADRRLSVAVEGSNGTAGVRVTDSGPGVPEGALVRLFEPFFSLKPTGTGLGLAIVQRIVEAHGGRIDATPIPSGGMTFGVELPVGGPGTEAA
jgi:signal transduction histidine kinase